MNISRFYLLIFPVIFLSCCTRPVKVEDVKPVEVKKQSEVEILEKFFKRSENDSFKAGNVLQKHNIIQHLTHLRKMDRGGKKYYLLEKDDITEMIKAVTEGIYLDYILINKNGDIVYTRTNDELFGRNINSGYESSPVQKCFLKRSGVYFEDVSFIYPSSKIYSLYISTPVYVEGDFHGVLVFQVDTKKICEILEPGTEIFSRDGIIRVTALGDRIFLKYPGFQNIDINSLDSNGVTSSVFSDGKIRFLKFNYKEINWILANKEL